MYGKITSSSGTVYRGQIRWGSEEVFWNDIFNSTKTSQGENTYEKYAQESKRKEWWQNIDGSILKIWDDEYSSQTHQFTCRFGDIKTIYPLDEDKLQCEFKNGTRLTFDGGSNDVGTTVIIRDYELGIVKLRWEKIKKIEFENTPESLGEKLGAPLYGTVKSVDAEFEGLIHWDKDERLTTDLLQGSTNTQKMEIAFEKIACIENLGDRSQVQLSNGKTVILHGSNDVNSENRGIVVAMKDIGQVEIPWAVFSSVCFKTDERSSGQPYSSYIYPERLHGIVKDLNGNEYNGLIIYDRDEKWDFEQLEGMYNDMKYIIPFRNIKTIVPKNSDYTYVILKNDKKLVLGKLQDVSSKNEGVIIILSDSKPKYIDWGDVDEIIFE
jgi:hypothetical protein